MAAVHRSRPLLMAPTPCIGQSRSAGSPRLPGLPRDLGVGVRSLLPEFSGGSRPRLDRSPRGRRRRGVHPRNPLRIEPFDPVPKRGPPHRGPHRRADRGLVRRRTDGRGPGGAAPWVPCPSFVLGSSSTRPPTRGTRGPPRRHDRARRAAPGDAAAAPRAEWRAIREAVRAGSVTASAGAELLREIDLRTHRPSGPGPPCAAERRPALRSLLEESEERVARMR